MSEKWVAIIDADGVLLMFDETGEADGIPVPVDCDLIPGQYMWVAELATWRAIRPLTRDARHAEPRVLRAIALGFDAVRNAGIELPRETVEWLEAFRASIDNAAPEGDKK